MAQLAQHDAVVSMDASDGGSLTDYSSDIQTVNLSGTYNGSQYHTVDGIDAKALVGGRAYTCEITYLNDPTASELADVMRDWFNGSSKAVDRSVQIQIPDATSGSLQIAFEALPGGTIDLANIVAGSGEAQTLTVQLNVNGAITITNIV